VDGERWNYSGKVRCCSFCFKMVQSKNDEKSLNPSLYELMSNSILNDGMMKKLKSFQEEEEEDEEDDLNNIGVSELTGGGGNVQSLGTETTTLKENTIGDGVGAVGEMDDDMDYYGDEDGFGTLRSPSSTPLKPQTQSFPSSLHLDEISIPTQVEKDEQIQDETKSKAFESLKNIQETSWSHLTNIVTQLVREEKIENENWISLIVDSVIEISKNARIRGEKMDIRHYLKVKKFLKEDSVPEMNLIHGVSFTKNVVNKKMRSNMNEPTLLLLNCPLEFQRIESKISSLEAIIKQVIDEDLFNFKGGELFEFDG
jgi:hypothetical protein